MAKLLERVKAPHFESRADSVKRWEQHHKVPGAGFLANSSLKSRHEHCAVRHARAELRSSMACDHVARHSDDEATVYLSYVCMLYAVSRVIPFRPPTSTRECFELSYNNFRLSLSLPAPSIVIMQSQTNRCERCESINISYTLRMDLDSTCRLCSTPSSVAKHSSSVTPFARKTVSDNGEDAVWANLTASFKLVAIRA